MPLGYALAVCISLISTIAFAIELVGQIDFGELIWLVPFINVALVALKKLLAEK